MTSVALMPTRVWKDRGWGASYAPEDRRPGRCLAWKGLESLGDCDLRALSHRLGAADRNPSFWKGGGAVCNPPVEAIQVLRRQEDCTK